MLDNFGFNFIECFGCRKGLRTNNLTGTFISNT
ncbi:hypothetical protein CY0110_16652 [Crocosphaera chwakensis CCY0110]|uniref:Uncharacterized protein n=1 Tax=Crocosphaera chwakensis CCY0110 TaxID=391612 RepID=A3II12_9CHRO|nr:hypothetical protein CY0110_16652 [Crocosphaera chwakensis CCY0110]